MTTTDSGVRTYARGTMIRSSYPWGLYASARVLCSDGAVRAVKRISSTADTFYSVPCAVSVRGRTVSGYLTVETLAGWTTETTDDPAVAKFVAYAYGANADALPAGAYREGDVPA